MAKKRFSIVAIIVVLAAMAGLAYIGLGGSKGGSAASMPGGAQAPGAPSGAGPGGKMTRGMPGAGGTVATAKSVRAKAAEIKTLRPYIDQGGDVQASITMSVYPDIGGRISDLMVGVGDSVAKGQQVASVDPSKPGSNYAISAVAAPISGTVTSILAYAGDTVSTSSAIAKIGVIDDLQIVVNLPERDSAKVKKGMSAKITLEALPGETLSATVIKVSPVLDSTSRTREVTIKLDSRDDRVAAGMYANVRIYTSPLANRIVAPVASVVTRDDETFVYVVADEGGKQLARKRDIVAGASVDDCIEVKQGLAVGDIVVYEGQDLLSDGAEVSVVAEGAK